MPRLLSLVLAILVGLMIASSTLRADWATPFVGVNNKVGDVAEVHGYVVASDSDDGPFMVIVTTDTMQLVSILAHAEKGAVPAARIGRWSIIKAQVVKAPTKGTTTDGMELKILGVRSAKPPAATQPQ